MQKSAAYGDRRAGGFEVTNPWAKDPVCRRCFPKELGGGCGGLELTKVQIKDSNILSVSGTILMRLLIGPFADQYGVRRTYAVILVVLSVPGFLAAAMDSYGALLVVRTLISLAGGSFVLTSLWTTQVNTSTSCSWFDVIGAARA